MFLYSWLHLAGYDLPMEEVKNFRVKDSKTPGHPEFGWTPGVESTTGPLGQGVGNGVGMAAAAKLAGATLNTPEHSIIDHHVVVLCGDGCLQEGVANEAVAFAGHEKLDNLILMYDSNGVTLDKMAEHTQSEDVGKRYEAYGWNVITLLDGHDLVKLNDAVETAKKGNGKPTLIICKTEIGRGIDEVAGTNAAHGEAGVEYVDAAREKLGLPAEKWFVSGETYKYFADHKSALIGKYGEWERPARGSRPTRTRRRRCRTRSTARRPTSMPPSRTSRPASRSRRGSPALRFCSRSPTRCPSTCRARPTCTARTRTT